jgi:protein TonB
MPGFSPGNVEEASEELVGDVEASVMTADSVDKRPEPMRRVDPKLPRRIVAKQLEGKVVVKALIDKEGRVERARIKSAEPKGVFESHVLEAVKQWQFQPASYEGKAVKTWIELPFNFKLG